MMGMTGVMGITGMMHVTGITPVMRVMAVTPIIGAEVVPYRGGSGSHRRPLHVRLGAHRLPIPLLRAYSLGSVLKMS